MKNLFTSVCLMAVTAVASAQPVFKFATWAVPPAGTDTVYGTVLTSVPVIPDAQWYSWDLTGIQIGTYRYYAKFATASGFTNAQYSNLVTIDNGPGMKYETSLMFAIENGGIKTYGERLARQAFTLGASTGNFNDSLVINQQDVTYSAPQVQMPYPCTMGTKWTSTSNSAVDIQITYNPVIIKQPGQRKSITTSTNEVIGWGGMKIKRLTDGKPSGTEEVLEVKTTITTVDSIYINGSPAPDVLLQQAGLKQGQTTTVYQKSFYRWYEILPMVNITYTDATFATRKDVNLHAQRLNYPDNVNDVPAVQVAEIYPNPANRTFSVKVQDAGKGNWSYTLTDMTGKKVTSAPLNFSSKVANVSLQADVIPGNYIINIEKDGVAVSGQKLVIQ